MGNVIKLNDAQYESLYSEVVNSNAENYCGWLIKDCKKAIDYVAELGSINVDDLRSSLTTLKSGITTEQTRFEKMGGVFKEFYSKVHYFDEVLEDYVNDNYEADIKGKTISEMEGTVADYQTNQAMVEIFEFLSSQEYVDPDVVFDYLLAFMKFDDFEGMTLADIQKQIEDELAKSPDEKGLKILLEVINDQYFVVGKNPHEIVFTAAEEPWLDDKLKEKLLEKLLKSKNVTLSKAEEATLKREIGQLAKRIANKEKRHIGMKNAQKIESIEQSIRDLSKNKEAKEALLKNAKKTKLAGWAFTVAFLLADSGYEIYQGSVNGLEWDKIARNVTVDVVVPTGVSIGVGTLSGALAGSFAGPVGTAIGGIVGGIGSTVIYFATPLRDILADAWDDATDWISTWGWDDTKTEIVYHAPEHPDMFKKIHSLQQQPQAQTPTHTVMPPVAPTQVPDSVSSVNSNSQVTTTPTQSGSMDGTAPSVNPNKSTYNPAPAPAPTPTPTPTYNPNSAQQPQPCPTPAPQYSTPTPTPTPSTPWTPSPTPSPMPSGK